MLHTLTAYPTIYQKICSSLLGWPYSKIFNTVSYAYKALNTVFRTGKGIQKTDNIRTHQPNYPLNIFFACCSCTITQATNIPFIEKKEITVERREIHPISEYFYPPSFPLFYVLAPQPCPASTLMTIRTTHTHHGVDSQEMLDMHGNILPILPNSKPKLRNLYFFAKTSSIELILMFNRKDNQLIYNYQKMDRKCLSGSNKRRYAQISIKRREGLVQSIQGKGFSISKAAKRFNIKLSTAKLIWKKYKETGKFYPKKGRKEEEQQANEAWNGQKDLKIDQSPSQKNEEGLALGTLEDNQHIMEYKLQELYSFYEPASYLPYWIIPASNFFYSFQNF